MPCFSDGTKVIVTATTK